MADIKIYLIKSNFHTLVKVILNNDQTCPSRYTGIGVYSLIISQNNIKIHTYDFTSCSVTPWSIALTFYKASTHYLEAGVTSNRNHLSICCFLICEINYPVCNSCSVSTIYIEWKTTKFKSDFIGSISVFFRWPAVLQKSFQRGWISNIWSSWLTLHGKSNRKCNR